MRTTARVTFDAPGLCLFGPGIDEGHPGGFEVAAIPRRDRITMGGRGGGDVSVRYCQWSPETLWGHRHLRVVTRRVGVQRKDATGEECHELIECRGQTFSAFPLGKRADSEE